MAFGRLGSLGTGFAHIGAVPGGGVAAPAGGALLLVGETSGFAADFTYATNAQRVAVKTAGAVVYSGTSFFTSSGTSSKWVYDVAGTLVNIPVGTLPLDYDPVTHAAKGLLVEPAATNLVVESAMGRPGFLAGGNGSTRTTSAQADPTGGSEALQVIITNALSSMNVFKQYDLATVSSVYTGSMWIKGTASQQVYFVTGDVPSQQLVTFTGAWQRVSLSITATATTLYVGFETLGRSNPNLPVVTFHIWGGQLETGTVATSYIPTLAATVTRAADKVNVTPASINYSATAGSWWVDVTHLRVVSVGQDRIVGYTSNYAPIYCGSSSYNLFDGGVISSAPFTIVGSHKGGMAFQNNDRAITADGLTPTADTTAGINLAAPGAAIFIGNDVSGTLPMCGYIRKVRYLPRRPTNAEMQTMTT